MIFSFEKKLIEWLQHNLFYVVLFAITLLSLYIRFTLRGFISDDASGSLLPWYDYIKAHGGIFSFSAPANPECNYSLIYQFLIGIMTYLPISSLLAYKLLSILFDYLLAIACGYLIYELTGKKAHALAAFACVACSPIVILNSAAWAQCDSIYTFWIILALIFLRKEKYIHTFIFYGIAFAFKFQAVFILPFFLFYYFYKKRFSIIYFGIIPLCSIVLSIPALVQDRTIADVFSSYIGNTSIFQSMTMGYPTFWRILDGFGASDAYGSLHQFAILFDIIVLGSLVSIWMYRKIELTDHNIIYIAFMLTYTTVMFLPAMHERYGFVCEILAIIIVIINRKTLPLLLALLANTIIIYGGYLYGSQISESFVAIINIIIYSAYMITLNKQIQATSI